MYNRSYVMPLAIESLSDTIESLLRTMSRREGKRNNNDAVITLSIVVPFFSSAIFVNLGKLEKMAIPCAIRKLQ